MLRFDTQELVTQPAASSAAEPPAYEGALVGWIPYLPFVGAAMIGVAYFIWATVL